jgi:cell division transport system permease protein
MTFFFLKKAITDILENRFLSSITVLTISLLVLMVGAILLVVTNTGQAIESWKHGIRLMVYLHPITGPETHEALLKRFKAINGVERVTFVSKEQGLEELKESMKRQSGIFEHLRKNPIPDAFEISVESNALTFEEHLDALEKVAAEVETFSSVDEVEYGRLWLRRIAPIFQIIRLAGLSMILLFFLAAGFIIANTVRLVLFARRQEIEILRLVGATNRFVQAPFFIESAIETALGTIIGLVVLFAGFRYINSLMQNDLPGVQLNFLSPVNCMAILLIGLCIGGIGCLFCLNQYLKI